MENVDERGARKTVKLKYVDDQDVEEIAGFINDSCYQKSKRSREKCSKKNQKEEDSEHEKDKDCQHDEVDILMDEVIPEEFMVHATNKLSEILLNNEEENQFGFQTPKKKQSMVLKAQESAIKYATPNKNGTPVRTKSGNNNIADVQVTPTTTCTLRKSARRNSVSFCGEMPATPSKGNILQGTPTKSNLKKTMQSITENRRTPTSKHRKEIDECSPSKQFKRGLSNEIQTLQTPTRRRSMAPTMSSIQEDTSYNQKTPHSLRQHLKVCIQKALQQGDSESEDGLGDFSSDSEDDFKPENESESSEEEPESDGKESDELDEENLSPVVSTRKSAQPLVEKKDQPSVTPTRRRRKEINDEFATDAYFESFASKDITSNNTLSRLRNPRLHEDIMTDLLKDTDVDHKNPLEKLTNEHRTLFQRWLFTLSEGFNILVFGVGSKRHLLHDFHDEVSDSQVLVVNGFFPGLTIKEILDTLLISLLRAKDVPANPLEAVELIEKIQSKRLADTLYLLIHNLDGPSLKNNKAQTVLSKLARIPNVRLIASVDHINAPLMWDQTKLYRYNFSWWDVTTFMPYTAETSFESSLLIQRTGALQLSSLHSVFKSLTKNAKELYLIIVKHQLQNASNQGYTGVRFQDLYWTARDVFLVSSEMNLRAALTEFLDHHMVKMKRGADESLIIPIDNAIIQQFLQSQEEKQD